MPSRVGHSLAKATMRQKDIIFGGELSGHYYLKKIISAKHHFLFCLRLLRKFLFKNNLFKNHQAPSKIYLLCEINFEIKDKEGTIKRLKKLLKARIVKFPILTGQRLILEIGVFGAALKHRTAFASHR